MVIHEVGIILHKTFHWQYKEATLPVLWTQDLQIRIDLNLVDIFFYLFKNKMSFIMLILNKYLTTERFVIIALQKS